MISRRKFRSKCFFVFLFFSLLCLLLLSVSKNIRNEISIPEICDSIDGRKFTEENRTRRNEVRKGFSFLISKENVCETSPHLDAIIFVISKSKNVAARDAIRRTWANRKTLRTLEERFNIHLKIFFLLDFDEKLFRAVRSESKIFSDIVQVDLFENYFLSTFRDVAALQWAQSYCAELPLTIKTDDDVFLNIFLLFEALRKILEQDQDQANVFGVKISRAQVVRSVDDRDSPIVRYLVTQEEFPCRFYPDYLSGFGYFVNRKARAAILQFFARDESPFHLSDVYVTGIIPEILQIQRTQLQLAINSIDDQECLTFFEQRNSFACASNSHHLKDSNVETDRFRQFHFYWNVIYRKRHSYGLTFRLKSKKILNRTLVNET